MARRDKSIYWGAFIIQWFKYLHESNLTSADYKILFYLCYNMKVDDNVTYVKQVQLSHELEMDKGNISRSIKKLKDEQFIARVPNGYMINPHLYYIGKSQTTRDTLRNNFDIALKEKKYKPRFHLNELFGELEDDLNKDDIWDW